MHPWWMHVGVWQNLYNIVMYIIIIIKEKKITLIIIESLNDSLLHIIGVPIEEN